MFQKMDAFAIYVVKEFNTDVLPGIRR